MGNTTARVGIYIRVSSEGQAAEDKDSLTNQLNQGVAYSNTLGLPYKLYQDIESGKNITRSGFQDLLDDISNKSITIVYIYKIDRFARDVADGATALKLMRKNKVKLIVSGKESNLDDYNETFRNNIELSFAELEASKIKERTLSAKIRNYEKGNKKKPAIYGYDAYFDTKGNRLIRINEDEAKIVRDIFTWFSTGTSLRQISIKLNNNHVPTKKGGVWRQPTIGGILKRIEYSGYTTNYDKTKIIHSIHYQEIIEKELWDKVQSIYSNIDNRDHVKGYRISANPLTSIITCSKCGARYYFKNNGHGELTYTHDYNIKCNQSPKYLNANKLESLYERLYKSLFEDDEITKEIYLAISDELEKNKKENEEVINRIEKELTEIKKQIANYIKAIGQGLDITDIKIELTNLQNHKKELEEKIDTIKASSIAEKELEQRIARLGVDASIDWINAKYNPIELRSLYLYWFRRSIIDGKSIIISMVHGKECRIDLSSNKVFYDDRELDRYQVE